MFEIIFLKLYHLCHQPIFIFFGGGNLVAIFKGYFGKEIQHKVVFAFNMPLAGF